MWQKLTEKLAAIKEFHLYQLIFGFSLLTVRKLAIFVLSRVRVSGAGPHLPTQEYIEYPPEIF